MRRARLNRAAGSGRSQPRGRAPNSSVTVTGLFIALRSDGWNTKRRFLSIMKASCSGPGSRIAWKWRKLRVRSRENARRLGDSGACFLNGAQPTLEAQIANFPDAIAYNNHDIDDGVRSGLLTLEQLEAVELWRSHRREAVRAWPAPRGRRRVAETVRRIIHTLIIDLITATARNIARVAPAHPDDVRRAPPLVAHSDAIAAQQRQLKQFLFKNLYRHYRVMRMTSKAQQIIRQLFNAFQHDPRLLPPDYQIQTMDMHAQASKIAHYIAGMTDRYALAEYRRLFVMETE